jgi:hypothetical protein
VKRTKTRVVGVLAMAALVLGAAVRVEAARRYSPGPQRTQSRPGGGWDRRSFGHHGGSFRHGGGGHHGHHGHGGTSFFFGFGAGALLTAPLWAYPRVYAAPVYTYPYPVYSYPAYPYPAYPYPPYAYPPPGYAPPPPPVGSTAPAYPPAPPAGAPGATTPTPEPATPTPGTSQGAPQPPAPAGAAAAAPETGARCQTVTVVGHWQSRIYPDGQRMTVWVPTTTRSVCQ